MLHRIYRATTLHDEQAIARELSKELSDELVADVFTTTVSTLNDSDGDPNAPIDNIHLIEFHSRAHHPATSVDLDCAWLFTASLRYWGQLHERWIQLNATLRLRTTDSTYHIDGLQFLDVYIENRMASEHQQTRQISIVTGAESG